MTEFAPPEPRRYSAFTALFLAPFFSGELSRDVARRWRGIGFWFLVLQLLITWLVVLVWAQLGFNKFVQNDMPKITDQIPPVTIKDGVASSPVSQPYTIKDPESGKPIVVIDTTGQINSLDETEAIILLNADKINFRDQGRGQVRTQSLAEVKSFYLDKQVAANAAEKCKKLLIPVGLPLLLVLTLIWRLVWGVIYALIGTAFNSMFNARLDFAALMRLAALAVWPMLLLETILIFTHVPGGCAWWLIYFVIVLIYLCVAVKANALPPGMFTSLQSGYAGPMQPPVYPPGFAPGQSPFPQAPPRPPAFPQAPPPPPYPPPGR